MSIQFYLLLIIYVGIKSSSYSNIKVIATNVISNLCDNGLYYIDIKVNFSSSFDNYFSFPLDLVNPPDLKLKCIMSYQNSTIHCIGNLNSNKLDLESGEIIIFPQKFPKLEIIDWDYDSFIKHIYGKEIRVDNYCSHKLYNSYLNNEWGLVLNITNIYDNMCRYSVNAEEIKYNFKMKVNILEGKLKDKLVKINEDITEEEKKFEIEFIQDIWVPLLIIISKDRCVKIDDFSFAFCSIKEKISENNINYLINEGFELDCNINIPEKKLLIGIIQIRPFYDYLYMKINRLGENNNENNEIIFDNIYFHINRTFEKTNKIKQKELNNQGQNNSNYQDVRRIDENDNLTPSYSDDNNTASNNNTENNNIDENEMNQDSNNYPYTENDNNLNDTENNNNEQNNDINDMESNNENHNDDIDDIDDIENNNNNQNNDMDDMENNNNYNNDIDDIENNNNIDNHNNDINDTENYNNNQNNDINDIEKNKNQNNDMENNNKNNNDLNDMENNNHNDDINEMENNNDKNDTENKNNEQNNDINNIENDNNNQNNDINDIEINNNTDKNDTENSNNDQNTDINNMENNDHNDDMNDIDNNNNQNNDINYTENNNNNQNNDINYTENNNNKQNSDINDTEINNNNQNNDINNTEINNNNQNNDINNTEINNNNQNSDINNTEINNNNQNSDINNMENKDIETSYINIESNIKSDIITSNETDKNDSDKSKIENNPSKETFFISLDYFIIDGKSNKIFCPDKPIFTISDSNKDIKLYLSKQKDYTFMLKGYLSNGLQEIDNKFISILEIYDSIYFSLQIIDNLAEDEDDQRAEAHCTIPANTLLYKNITILCTANKISEESMKTNDTDITLNWGLEKNRLYEDIIIRWPEEKKKIKHMYSYTLTGFSLVQSNYGCFNNEFYFYIYIYDLYNEPDISFELEMKNPTEPKAICKIYESSILKCYFPLYQQRLEKSTIIDLPTNFSYSYVDEKGNKVIFLVDDYDEDYEDFHITVRETCGDYFIVGALKKAGLDYFKIFLIVIGISAFAFMVFICFICYIYYKIKHKNRKGNYIRHIEEGFNNEVSDGKI